jgi:cytochrome P450
MHPDQIDLMDPQTLACPFDAYKTLRNEAPVYVMPGTGLHVVTRYDDIAEIIRKPEIFSMRYGGDSPLFKHASARAIYAEKGWERWTPLANDPPAHTLYRKLVDVGFTAGRVRKLEPRITELIGRLIDDFADLGEVEFVQAFCVPLPMTVITDRLGLPLSDMPRLKIWSDAWVQPFSLKLTEAEEIKYATLGVELQHYLAEKLEERRRKPGEDLLSDIATARYNDERPLTMTEMLGLAEQILVGGNETTTNALAMGMRTLIDTPGLEARLRGDESAVKTFVEEVLRLESPTQGLYRIATQDTEFSGQKIPKGAIVHLRFAAANRDERQFPNPDICDISRRNAGAHMAFSQAHHHCLGAPLARQEMLLAFRCLVDRFENLRFAPSKNSFEYIPSFALRALKELWIGYDSRRVHA